MGNNTVHKVHDFMYPATYNFRDEADGTSGTDIEFVDINQCDSCVIEASYLGHAKILHFTDSDAGQIRNTGLTATSGTIELWVNNPTADDWYFIPRGDGGESFGQVRYTSKTNIRCYYGNGAGGTIWADTTVVADSWNHVRIRFDCGTDTVSIWINGVLKVDDEPFVSDATATNISYVQIYNDGACEGYIDAIGYSWDTDYAIGDNVHWRHYKESTDSFEGDDVGTVYTDITWVDGSETAGNPEIIAEFNSHKKVLRAWEKGATNDYFYHNFASAGTSGWIEFWMKADDATKGHNIYLREVGLYCVYFQIDGDLFQVYTGGAQRAVDGAPVPEDGTWYHIYIPWYQGDGTDYFDVWIDNVLYETAIPFQNNMVGDGISNAYFVVVDGGTYMYLDAYICSLDGDSRGDNRTFDYHATYTAEDITDEVLLHPFVEDEYGWSILTLSCLTTTLTFSTASFIRVWDANNELRFEGFYHGYETHDRVYTFHDLNKTFLEHPPTYAPSAAEDANATFLGICTNVGQEDGRCIYYTEDDPAGNLTPILRGTKPFRLVASERAAIASKILIIKANGVCFLDDDAVPPDGPYTITEASGEIVGLPIETISETQVNYVKVEGAINLDTGAPYYGVSEDTSAQSSTVGIVRYYRRFHDLRSNTDCESKAASLRANLNPSGIVVELRGVYALPGEIINFAYSPLSITAANYYVETVTYNLNSGTCTYTLTDGLFSANDAEMIQFSETGEHQTDMGASIYETDINTVDLQMRPYVASWTNDYIVAGDNEGIAFSFYVGSKIDSGRDILISITYIANGAGSDFKWYVESRATDDSEGMGVWNVENGTGDSFPAGTNGKINVETYTLDSGDFTAGDIVRTWIILDNGEPNITFMNVTAQYYIKRE